MEKVSIIVPVYNAEIYLDECISSILEQDYDNFELILVNDGSVDNSEKICRRYAEKDRRVCYIAQKNSGVSAARNAGLRAISGEYVCFVDSDDKLPRQALTRLISSIEEEKSDLVIGSYKKMYLNYEVPVRLDKRTIDGKREIASFIDDCCSEAAVTSVWGKLYVRSLIDYAFDTSMSMGEDDEYRKVFTNRKCMPSYSGFDS